MRVVLLALAVLAMILGPLAGPGGVGRAAADAATVECHHGGSSHHAAAPAVADGEGHASPCADGRGACPGAIHCVSLACGAAALPAGAAWPPVERALAAGRRVGPAVHGVAVSPPFKPPRP